jgi:hypothetical protein
MELRTRTTTTAQRVGTYVNFSRGPTVYGKGRHCTVKRACGGKELNMYNPGPECCACGERPHESTLAELMTEAKS